MDDDVRVTDSTIRAEIQQMLRGAIVPRAIQVAAELGVADALANGPRSVADLARAVGADVDAVHRLLPALASIGIFTEVSERTFALTPRATYLRDGVPGSLRRLAGMVQSSTGARLACSTTAFVLARRPFPILWEPPGLGGR
jgi:hypothetical protein